MRLGCLCVFDKVNGLPVVSVHYPSSHGAFNMAGRSESSMEESALVTLIPDCQAGGKITGHWSTGHGITVHASEGKPTSAQPLGHYRFPVLHEVKWHADVHTTIMRKLINETHGIFLDLQQLPEAGGTSRKSSLLTISRRYRAVLRSCLLQLKDKIDIEPMAVDGNQNTSTQKQLLTFIELVWHLCEILFIESLPGGAVLPRLLEWSKTEDTDKYVAQVLQYPAPHESPAYWPAIYSLVLHGQLNDARELLAQHPDSRDQLGSYDMFESMDELLRRMPLYQYYMGQTSSEFLVKWNHWQHECKSQLESDTYVADPCLQTLCEILAGKEEVFDESILKDSCPTWYQMLTAKLLYCNPVVKVFDLQYHTQSCIEMFGGDMGSLDKILLSAFEFDVSGVIKQSSESFGSWWFVAHLTDLLDHAGQLDSNQISSPISLREFLLLEYSASLMSHHSLWQIAVDYLKQCPQYGRAHLEEYVEHLPLETEKKALKVLRLCEDLDMSVQAQSICKTMSMRALRNSRLGSALSWCLRSKDSAFAAFISDRFLEEYIKCGGFSNLDLIDNLGSAMLLSDRLTFLGKYREFHKTYEECRFQDAAALLISLLTSKLAPKSLWLTLLTDALPLLEHEKVIFSSNQTYELMHCLEEIRLSFRSSEYMDLTEDQGEIRKQGSKMGKKGKTPKATKAQGEEEQDRVDLLRLAMARNLARAILKEGQLVN